MKTLYLKSLLLAFISLIVVTPSQASHLVGGTVSYEYLGFNTQLQKEEYLVTSVVFRDPSGVNFTPPMVLSVYKDSTGYPPANPSSISLNNHVVDSIYSIPYVCVYDPNQVNSFWSQRYTMWDTLRIDPSLTGFHIMYQTCCRNPTITNVVTGGMSWYAFIPPTLFQNSSVHMADPLNVFVCEDVTVRISNIYNESDGDSLVFSSVTPYDGDVVPPLDDTVSYQSVYYSGSKPMGQNSTFSINSATGEMEIYADSVGVYVMAIQVDEYRNGNWLSKTIKDFQVMVYTCNTLADSCVWPGDANDDGLADVFDVFPIALGFGTSGTPRLNASTGWYAQNSADWVDTFANGLNYKFSDCDGDSVIGLLDFAVVGQNYGWIHSKSNHGLRASTDPPVWLSMASDTLAAGSVVELKLHIGSSSNQVNDLFATAFEVSYNSALIDSGTMTFTTPASWLGNTQTDIGVVAHDSWDKSKFAMGFGRTDHMNQSGDGLVAKIGFKLSDTLTGSAELIFEDLEFNFTRLEAIDNNGDEVKLSAQSTKVTIYEGSLSTKVASNSGVKAYPNPNRGSFVIDQGNFEALEMNIFDVNGRVIHNIQHPDAREMINTNLKAGVYFIQLIGSNDIEVLRISVM